MGAEQENGELIDRLAALYEAARVRVAEEMTRRSMVPLVPWTQQVVKREESDGVKSWSFQQETVLVNSLTLGPLTEWSPEMLAEWILVARRLAQELSEKFDDQIVTKGMPPVSVFTGPNWANIDTKDPVDRMLHGAIVKPMDSYVRGLPSPQIGDPNRARSIAIEVMKALATGLLPVRRSIPIAGIETREDVLNVDNCTIRRLSPSEIGQLTDFGTLPNFTRLTVHKKFNPLVPTHMLEVHTDTNNPSRVGLLPVPSIFLALLLHGYDLAGSGVMTTSVAPELGNGRTITTMIPTKEYTPNSRLLELAVLRDASGTAKRLEHYSFGSPTTPQEISFHRFMLGCSRKDPADKLIDFTIALEALLLPSDGRSVGGELSYRFRVNGASFLVKGTSYEERLTISDQLKDIYSTRSRLVHGSKLKRGADLDQVSKTARDLAASGLLRAASEGFPDAQAFEALVLGR